MVRRALLRLAARGALGPDAVRVVDESIKHRVGDGRVSDVVVPLFDGQLTREDGRAQPVAILDHFEHVAYFADRDRSERGIVISQHGS